jgi:DNA end-binding protein Ku
VVSQGAPETTSNVVDLMEALRASVASAKEHRPGNAEDVGKLTTRRARRGSGGGRNSEKPGRLSGDLDAMSKKELYDLAQQLDVPGRSTMTRDELEDAVRDARDGAGSKAS